MSTNIKAPATRGAKTLIYAFYIFIISLYLFSASPPILISTLLSAIGHETAHLTAARILGRKTAPLAFSPTGYYPSADTGTALSCVPIYLAGPAFNLAVGGVCMFLMREGYSQILMQVFVVNISLCIFNLLPIPYSDGDGALRSVMSLFCTGTVIRWVCSTLNILFSFMLFVFFSYRFFILGCGFYSFFLSFVFVICSLTRIFGE